MYRHLWLWPQPQMSIHVDNTTVIGIVNNMIKRQRSRAMEMRYFWLLDQMAQQYFKFYYQPGLEKLANYPTKHHLSQIHQHVRPYYLQMPNSPTELLRASKPSLRGGCVGILGDPYIRQVPLPRIPNYRKPSLGSEQLPRIGGTTQKM